MTDKAQTIELLHSACVGISQYWEDHLEFWEGDEPGYFNDAAVFAHYVVDQYEHEETSDFSEIFSVVENIILKGNKAAIGIAVVGFLEAVQNIASHRSFGESVFKQWMGKESLKAWQELNELWAGKSSLADVIRSQK